MQLMKVPEVAQRLRMGKSSVYQLIQRGQMPVVRIGAAIRVPEDALEAWLRRRTEQPAENGHRVA